MFDSNTQSNFTGWSNQGEQGSSSFYEDLDFMLQLPIDVSSNSSTNKTEDSNVESAEIQADAEELLEPTTLHSVFELLPEGACLLDRAGRISRTNSHFLKMLSQQENDLLGLSFMKLVSECDPLNELEVDEIFESDLTVRIPITLVSADNQEIWVSLNARRIYSEETLRCIGFIVTLQLDN